MTRWNEGYVADVAYTSNIYREITPAWLHLASLLLGQRPPDLSKPFRYAELGCGYGLTAAVVAACHPEAEVWGFDFNPSHVEGARDFAAAAGLANLRYEERSFAELAAAHDLPSFDVITLHGVFSWISRENRRAVVRFIDRFLRPGGLVYISYNVATGWSSMGPIHSLMRRLAASSGARSDDAVRVAAQFIDRLREGGAAYMPAHPALEPRLKMLSTLDARYVAHEYLNEHWLPQMSADVAAELAEAKCVFVGSATLSDNIDAASVPAGMMALLSEQRDTAMRETVRDFGCAQSFRRDIFRRGLNGMPAAEHLVQLEALTFLGLGRRAEEEISFQSSLGQVTGKPEVYRPLVEALAAGPLGFAAAKALPAFEGKPLPELVQALTLLVSGGFAAPLRPEAAGARRDAGKRLNIEIARANGMGGATGQLVAPAIGSTIGAELIETLIVGDLLAGRPADPEALAASAAAALARTGRHVQADGAAITDPAAAGAAVRAVVDGVLAHRVPLLQSLGVLD